MRIFALFFIIFVADVLIACSSAHWACGLKTIDMETNLIVNIAFLAVLVFAMCVMLRTDMALLSKQNWNTADFYDWVRSSDEPCTTKRIVLLAVFIASTTSYAQESWMVVVILALATLSVPLYQITHHREMLKHTHKRQEIRYFLSLLIAAVTSAIVAATSESTEQAVQSSVYSILFFTTFSYADTLLANYVASKWSEF